MSIKTISIEQKSDNLLRLKVYRAQNHKKRYRIKFFEYYNLNSSNL